MTVRARLFWLPSKAAPGCADDGKHRTMELPAIKTYKPGQQQPLNSFYVLSKGENAGKPMREACPNCFTVTCSTAADAQYWYYLSLGLWQSQSFKPYLTGSVIPFIRLSDYSGVIARAGRKTIGKPEQLMKAIETLAQIEEFERNTKAKLALLAQAKIAVFRKVLHSDC